MGRAPPRRGRGDVSRGVHRLGARPFNFAPTGGEPGQRVLERGVRAFQEIVLAHPGECVLVVSHKATIRLIIAHVLGFDPRGYRDRLDQLPACLNMIDMYPDGTGRLRLLNDVSHYTVDAAAVAHGRPYLIMDDAAFWHRLQFAFTITYHYLFPQLTMGLAWFLVSGSGVRCERATNDTRRPHDSGPRSSASPLPSVS